MDLFSQANETNFTESRQAQQIRKGVNRKKVTTFDILRLKMIKEINTKN